MGFMLIWFLRNLVIVGAAMWLIAVKDWSWLWFAASYIIVFASDPIILTKSRWLPFHTVRNDKFELFLLLTKNKELIPAVYVPDMGAWKHYKKNSLIHTDNVKYILPVPTLTKEDKIE